MISRAAIIAATDGVGSGIKREMVGFLAVLVWQAIIATGRPW
jgi:hypothetical protein